MEYITYLHSDKSTNIDKGKELGLSEAALDLFVYSLYEVEFNMEVDVETGETRILGVAGVKLEEPVKS